MKRAFVFVMLLALLAVFLSPVAAGPAPKAWTYLVYMGADNNLDTQGGFSLNLLKQGLTSDRDINIVALYDHPNNVPTDLLQVTSKGIIPLHASWLVGNLDTGSPATLQQFLSWGATQFPATHYVVVIWNHGGGWKYIVLDGTSNSRMSIEGLGGALEAVAKQIRRPFDITVFDACLMSLVEVTAQMRNGTNYVVASEQVVSFQGLPYHLMVQRLVANPSVASGAYARGIADDFYTYYVQSSSKSALSITATDESKLAPLTGSGGSIDNLSVTLLAKMAQFYPAIGSARAVAQHQVNGVNGVFWYIDLHRFADQLALNVSDPIVKTQAAAIVNHLNNAINERHSHNLDGSAYGLGINFPPNLSRYQDKSYLAQNYQNVNLAFVKDTHWDEMLLAFYGYQK